MKRLGKNFIKGLIVALIVHSGTSMLFARRAREKARTYTVAPVGALRLHKDVVPSMAWDAAFSFHDQQKILQSPHAHYLLEAQAQAELLRQQAQEKAAELKQNLQEKLAVLKQQAAHAALHQRNALEQQGLQTEHTVNMEIDSVLGEAGLTALKRVNAAEERALSMDVMLDMHPTPIGQPLTPQHKQDAITDFSNDVAFLQNIIMQGETHQSERESYTNLFNEQQRWFDTTITSSMYFFDPQHNAAMQKAASIKRLVSAQKKADTVISQMLPAGILQQVIDKIRLTVMYELNALMLKDTLESADLNQLVGSVLAMAGIEPPSLALRHPRLHSTMPGYAGPLLERVAHPSRRPVGLLRMNQTVDFSDELRSEASRRPPQPVEFEPADVIEDVPPIPAVAPLEVVPTVIPEQEEEAAEQAVEELTQELAIEEVPEQEEPLQEVLGPPAPADKPEETQPFISSSERSEHLEGPGVEEPLQEEEPVRHVAVDLPAPVVVATQEVQPAPPADYPSGTTIAAKDKEELRDSVMRRPLEEPDFILRSERSERLEGQVEQTQALLKLQERINELQGQLISEKDTVISLIREHAGTQAALQVANVNMTNLKQHAVRVQEMQKRELVGTKIENVQLQDKVNRIEGAIEQSKMHIAQLTLDLSTEKSAHEQTKVSMNDSIEEAKSQALVHEIALGKAREIMSSLQKQLDDFARDSAESHARALNAMQEVSRVKRDATEKIEQEKADSVVLRIALTKAEQERQQFQRTTADQQQQILQLHLDAQQMLAQVEDEYEQRIAQVGEQVDVERTKLMQAQRAYYAERAELETELGQLITRLQREVEANVQRSEELEKEMRTVREQQSDLMRDIAVRESEIGVLEVPAQVEDLEVDFQLHEGFEPELEEDNEWEVDDELEEPEDVREEFAPEQQEHLAAFDEKDEPSDEIEFDIDVEHADLSSEALEHLSEHESDVAKGDLDTQLREGEVELLEDEDEELE